MSHSNLHPFINQQQKTSQYNLIVKEQYFE